MEAGIGTGLLAAALAIGIPGFAAALGIGLIGRAGLESMARNPNTASRLQTAMLIAAALAEAIAIYGLIIAFVILGKI